MIPIPTFLASVEAADSVSSVVVIGFLFVLMVLAILALVTSVMGTLFTKQAAASAAKAAELAAKAAESAAKVAASTPVTAAGVSTAGTSTPAPAKTEESDDDPAIMAVVAAAVHSVIGDRAHRIVSIRSSGPGWAQEGRRQIFSSHRVR